MSLNQNNNSPEWKEELKNDSSIDSKWKFLSEFWKEILSSDERLNFIDDIVQKWSIWDSVLVKTKLDEFKALSNDKDINNFDISKLTIFDLKKLVWKDFLKLNNLRNSLKKKLLSNYLITDEDYTKIFENKVNSENESVLNGYINSENELNIFITWLIWDVPKREDLFPIDFLNITDVEKEKRFNRLVNDSERNLVKGIIFSINNWRFIESDIRLLFATNFLENSEKETLVRIFVPNITLQKALDIWIIDTAKANNIKTKLIDDLSIAYDYDKTELKDFLFKMPFDDFLVDINNIDLNSDNVSIISENIGFKNAETDFIKSKEEFEQEIVDNWPMSLVELQKWLKSININERFTNLDKFSEWNIIKFVKKWENWEDIIQFIKIQKVNDLDKKLTFLTVWSWTSINLDTEWEGNLITYVEFLNNIGKSDTKIICFDNKEIAKKIKDPSDLDFMSSDLDLFSSNDILNSTEEEKENYKNHYKKIIEDDLNVLKDELNQNWWDKSQILLLSNKIEAKEKEINHINNNLDDNTKLLDFLNKQKFIENLDEVDIEWKKVWFEKWIKFESKWSIYTIIWFENNEIYLTSLAWKEWPIDFISFYETFKKNKSKRLDDISDFSNLIQLNKIDNNKWNDHEIINNELKVKWINHNDKTEDKVIDYLVSDDGDEVFKINKIDWDSVNIQFWERKNIWNMNDKEKKKYKGKEWEVIYLNDNESTISITELNSYISKYKLHPDWKVWKTLESEQVKDLENDFKWSFVTRLFNRTSLNEIIAWWTMFIDWFKESIKRWNDLHAAKFALAMWKMLPEEIRADLQIKVEREEAEEMDKALEGLWKVDSWDAIFRIKWWLENKDTPEFKKEAWLMFMISKYGLLYAKKGLWPYKWKFLWYEAFWWKINDELYLKVKKDSEDENIPFTEENLMFLLVTEQCKGWYNWIKRRWRLYKEFDWKISQGISDEIDKWSKEAKSMRNFETRNNTAKGEFIWWEFNNWLWKYKEAVNRWSALHNLNELPFMILFSWAGSLLQEEQLNEFKNFTEWEGFWGLLFTKFLSDTTWMKTFNKTIVNLSEKFEDIDPGNFKWMLSHAKWIFNDQWSRSITLSEKLKNAEEFWWKYWEPLTRTMLKLNNQNNTFSKTDKILINNEEEFSEYNNLLEEYMWPADFTNDKIMNDQFANQWVSWLWHKVLDDIWSLTPEWTFRNWEPAKNILNEITWEISNSLSQDYVYSDDQIIDRKIRVKNISNQLSIIFTYIKNKSNANLIKSIIEWDAQWFHLEKLWISKYIANDDLKPYSIDELANLDTVKVRKFINNAANRMLDWNVSNDTWFTNDFDEIVPWTKTAVNNTMYNKEDNEEVA